MPDILRKVKIVEVINHIEYEAQDVLNQESIKVEIKGKIRMNYILLPVGAVVFVVTTEDAPTSGRLIPEKDICFSKRNEHLCQQKRAIEQEEDARSNN